MIGLCGEDAAVDSVCVRRIVGVGVPEPARIVGEELAVLVVSAMGAAFSVQGRFRIDLLLRPCECADDADLLCAADGNVWPAAVAVDDLDSADGGVAARAADSRQYLALSCVRERMEAGQGAHVVEVGEHVGVEDDLYRAGDGRSPADVRHAGRCGCEKRGGQIESFILVIYALTP